ncbi:MAG: ferrous iron transporter B, partial [Bacteroidetes bacterium]|nr:ferrous iron transporter B [Bacteroidota bacterium]
MTDVQTSREALIAEASGARWELDEEFHDSLIESMYQHAAQIADRAVTRTGQKPRFDLDRAIDSVVTSRWLGYPVMFLLLAIVFWLTVEGANYPSRMISGVLLGGGHPWLKALGESVGFPWWLSG